MLDFTLNGLGGADAPLGDGTDQTTTTTTAGAAGESFARALAEFTRGREEETPDPDGEATGDPAHVVATAGVAFVAEPLPAGLVPTQAAAGLAAGIGNENAGAESGADVDEPEGTFGISSSAQGLLGWLRAATGSRGAAGEPMSERPAAASTPFSGGSGESTPVPRAPVNASSEHAASWPAPEAERQGTGVPSTAESSGQTSGIEPLAAAGVTGSARAGANTPTGQAAAGSAERQTGVAVDEHGQAVLDRAAAGSQTPSVDPAITGAAAEAGVEPFDTSSATKPDRAAFAARDRDVSSAAARSEATGELPEPYFLRSSNAATGDGQRGDSHSGTSMRNQTAFGFGGGHGSLAQALPALKLASASFASALANTPADDVLPADTATQIVQSLKLQWARGGGEAEIRLEPKHFGELRIALKVDEGRVAARLEAEAPVVREWLQTNQAALRHSLADQNLTLDRLEVVEPRESRDAERRDRHSDREAQPKPRHGRRRRAEGGELFEVVA